MPAGAASLRPSTQSKSFRYHVSSSSFSLLRWRSLAGGGAAPAAASKAGAAAAAGAGAAAAAGAAVAAAGLFCGPALALSASGFAATLAGWLVPLDAAAGEAAALGFLAGVAEP
jgi:hypothetical protein